MHELGKKFRKLKIYEALWVHIRDPENLAYYLELARAIYDCTKRVSPGFAQDDDRASLLGQLIMDAEGLPRPDESDEKYPEERIMDLIKFKGAGDEPRYLMICTHVAEVVIGHEGETAEQLADKIEKWH